MLLLAFLVLSVFSLLSLLSVLLIQTELCLCGCGLSKTLSVTLVGDVDFVVKALSKLVWIVVGWLFSKRRAFVGVGLSVLKCVLSNRSFVFIAYILSHVLLSILVIIGFSASFPLSLLSIWRFPSSSSNSRWSLPEVVCFPIQINLFLIVIFILWNASIGILSLVVHLLPRVMGWCSLTHLWAITVLSLQSEGSLKVGWVFNLFKLCNVFVLSGEFLIVMLLQVLINCQNCVMCWIDRLAAWDFPLNVFLVHLLWRIHHFPLTACHSVHLLHFVRVDLMLHSAHV